MKLLTSSILLISVILLTHGVGKANAFSSFSLQQIIQQDTSKRDTSKKASPNNSGLDQKVEYRADSVRFSKNKSIIYMYGNARVNYGDFELDADYIRYDSQNKLIFASGRTDSKTNRYVGKPIFKSGTDGSAIADSLYYNSETTKAKVYGVFSEQEGGFFSGGQSKKQIDDELHIKNVMYSTCNLPHPHFGILITKGIATEKQIISGPMYMVFEGVPTPIGLPFAFFPKPNKRTSGIILPSPGEDATRGFFLQNGGYYLGLNDYWDAKLLGSIYTNGSYETNLTSNYIKRYKFSGNIGISYNSVKNGLEGTEAFENPNKDFSIRWSHSQNANANPGTTFSASVNVTSSSYYTNSPANLNYDLNAIANNTTNSSISYSKTFSNNMNYSLSMTSNQTLRTRDVSIRLPDATFNVPTFSPFDSKTRVGEQKWYQKITIGYALQGTNAIDTKDSLLFQNDGLKRLRSGFSHSIPINMSFTALKYLNFSLGGSYNEVWNFQHINKRFTSFDDGTYTERIDTLSGFKRAGSYSLSTSMSTKIYGQKKFKNLGNIMAMRHVITPNVSFNYSPDFTKAGRGPFLAAIDQNGKEIRDTYQQPLTYSVFQGMAYQGSFPGKAAAIGFGVDNTVELKVKSSKDTTGTGERKIPIIQGLSISGSYNFLAPRNKLSTLSFNGRSQFTDKLGINYNGTFDPYDLDESVDPVTGQRTFTRSNNFTLRRGGRLARLTNIGFSFDYSLNPDALKKKNEANDKLSETAKEKGLSPLQSEQLAAISRDPNAFVDFNIPWNFSFSYSFQYSNDFGVSTTSNTLNFNGDFNLTPKWKFTFNSGYDFQNNGLTPMNIGIYRDLHCWDMSVNWVPYGAYKSYSVTLKVKASILQDLKLSKRQGFYNTYQ
ncbi:putative LPS assembly protein LptD [Pedobacter sp. MC2016-05]|uniref:putative LPS assembly protein LptD n=1 Tax=Pedobacter sp. MC2016-05 TaxID=2994474 RepID=UPI0022460BD3|nr:putative LPS assembly protein LptD [Pedobacter sp. MC2016-05]MCX2474490.1 putative LPS assembly protein LptD [Pedobacter sp. MC2016-05]